VKIENEIEIALPLARAWPLLLDVPAIAPCVPGAELTEVLGGNRYRGRAAIKIGPLLLEFAGEAELVEVNEAQHTARILARGDDTKKRGNASADVFIRLSALDPGRTRVAITTDLNLVGTIAQYGRASGLIRQIGQEVMNQFALNLGRLHPAGGDGGLAPSGQLEAQAVGAQVAGLSWIGLLLRALGNWLRNRGKP
jgi:carbon monoxide dehydrogenase subunit G